MVKVNTIINIADELIHNSFINGNDITLTLITCAVRNATEIFPDVSDEIVIEATNTLAKEYKAFIN